MPREGAKGKSMGSVAASWKATTLASGVQCSLSAAAGVMSTHAAAPSLSVDAFPAVTEPPSFCLK